VKNHSKSQKSGQKSDFLGPNHWIYRFSLKMNASIDKSLCFAAATCRKRGFLRFFVKNH